MVKLPFPGSPSFTEEITLEDRPYRFRFDWNYTGNYWSMMISDRELNVLVAGIKIVPAYELIADFPGRNLPPGELYAIDTTGEVRKIGRNDIGDRVQLIYVESTE